MFAIEGIKEIDILFFRTLRSSEHAAMRVVKCNKKVQPVHITTISALKEDCASVVYQSHKLMSYASVHQIFPLTPNEETSMVKQRTWN